MIHYNTLRYITIRHNTSQYMTIHYNTWYMTIHYSTLRNHSITRHSFFDTLRLPQTFLDLPGPSPSPCTLPDPRNAPETRRTPPRKSRTSWETRGSTVEFLPVGHSSSRYYLGSLSLDEKVGSNNDYWVKKKAQRWEAVGSAPWRTSATWWENW